ncbi:hypothetical protein [Nocardia anaemiae]|uniref:hypothetical protein n=1 Tax=Nocardia anaemiae TaxID=263910 RepID=UPI0007A54091|nr:hypothetical protein [Nocardia anaemiae]
MPAELVTVMVVAATVMFFLWLVFYGLPYLLRSDSVPDDAIPATDILERVASESSRIHPAPPGGYTVEEAGYVLQEHLECSREICDAKNTAYWVRAEAGKLQPTREAVR